MNGGIVSLVISSLICGAFAVTGIFLLMGKGSFLIAGFNTLTKGEKSEYDEKALFRFIGKILIACTFCVAAIYIGGFWKIPWLSIIGVVMIFVLGIGAIIYAGTGNRFKKVTH